MHSKPCQTSKMGTRSIFGVWQGSENASAMCTYFAIRGVRSFARIFAKKHPKEQHSKPASSFTFW